MEFDLSDFISEDAVHAGMRLLDLVLEDDQEKEEVVKAIKETADDCELAGYRALQDQQAELARNQQPIGPSVQEIIAQDLPSEEEDLRLTEYLESDDYIIAEAQKSGNPFMRVSVDGVRRVAYPDGRVDVLPPTKLGQTKEVNMTWMGGVPLFQDVFKVQALYPELSEVPHPDMTWTDPKDIKDGARSAGSGARRSEILQQFLHDAKNTIWLKENMLAILTVLHLDGRQIPDVLWISRNPLLPEFPSWWHGQPHKGRQLAVEALLASGYVKYDEEGFLTLAERTNDHEEAGTSNPV